MAIKVVTSENKSEFDRAEMVKRGQLENKKEEPSIAGLKSAFEEAIAHHTSLGRRERIENSKNAREIVGQHVGYTNNGEVKDLLSKNQKLAKAEKGYKGEKPIQMENGDGVETTGLSLSPAHQEGKFNTCPNSKSCSKTCLGKTSGGNIRFKAPSENAARKTEAFLRNPKEFAVRLHDEIQAAKTMADLNGNHLGVRLNTLSDIHPKVWKPLFDAHPDVSFYDYTKLDTDSVAPNHHLTYSSTGISQNKGDNGLEESVHNPHQNWRTMRRRLEQGHNVAMAFSHHKFVPNELHDEETGNKYTVVDGNTHDFRTLDKQPKGSKGVIVGLKNSAANTSENKAANQSNGFLVHYDPQLKRENDKKGAKLVRDEEGNEIVQNRKVMIPIQAKQKINLDNDSNPTK
jgi:hypothetical protein